MKIVYGRQLNGEERLSAEKIAAACGISPDTARLLFCRGFDTKEKVREYLNPDKRGFHNPFMLRGMKEACERVRRAKDNGENVLIFGDYDADGVCASSILYFCLKEYGITARVEIPERDDGYGLNLGIIERVNAEKKIDLLITVDCGISEHAQIEILKERGIDVIVTDHHEPPELLPECIVVNPKIAGQEYPFDGLCGAGVAYKFGAALIGKAADRHLDSAALATVADSMELIGENRCIVAEGLKIINSRQARSVFNYLSGENSSNRKTTSQTLAFQIAPRLNAGGRMGDAKTALKAFTSENENEIFDCCALLNKYNIARQTECDEIYRAAKTKIKEERTGNDEVILVADESWKTGFIGIVAARLTEDYARPVIVFAGVNGGYKGSARSVAGINIYEALCSAESLLVGFGGHSQAAGVSVEKQNFAALRTALCEYVRTTGTLTETEKTLYADGKAEEKISLGFVKEIERMEPFGVGNRRPVFTAEAAGAVKALPIKAGSPHYFFSLDAAEMLDFSAAADVDALALPVKKTVAFELNYSEYKGRESFKGIVRCVLPDYGDFSSVRAHVVRNEILNRTSRVENAPIFSFQGAPFKLESGLGRVYAVSDAQNLKDYDCGGLEKFLFAVPPRHSSNCVVVSPSEIGGDYSEVVWLDSPAREISSGLKTAVAEGCKKSALFSGVSAERAVFADIFTYLVTLNGKNFASSAEAYYAYSPRFGAEQFVFAAEVFLELGIFKINNGRLFYDARVKSALTNSEIYNFVSGEAKL